MNVELTIKVCKIELENASDLHKNGQTKLAIEILRCMAAYLNGITPKALTFKDFQNLLDELRRIDKLPPKDPQAEAKG